MGLEELGSKGNSHIGVFERTRLDSVVLPAALKRLEPSTFSECCHLVRV